MEYVVDEGIRVSNNSWGTQVYSQSLYDVIEASQAVGHIFVASAGNYGVNTDVIPHYPASYDLPNIISVAATDNDDDWATFPSGNRSNYGPITVDLGAPGVTVYSTSLGTGYAVANGTSMAAPHVTGVVALVMSRRPDWTWEQVKSRILAGVRPVDSLLALTATGGVVNAMAVGDCNGNGIDDEFDISGGTSEDCSGNGIPDECEPDCNGNDVADSCDVVVGTSDDCNGNVIPDECEPDCNDNGVADACDLAAGTGEDCNNNVVLDECDIAGGTSADCNINDVPDECDILIGTSEDCTVNGVPDECETLPDCNGNGAADANDLCNGIDDDCDGNGVPDECQDTSADCNENGQWDACDIAGATSADCNENGVPDECDLAGGTSNDCDENDTLDDCESHPRVLLAGLSMDPDFRQSFSDLGYDVDHVDFFPGPSPLEEYDILAWSTFQGSAHVAILEDYVYNGGGFILLENYNSHFPYTAGFNPVEDRQGWVLRTGTTVTDPESPLVAGLGPDSSLSGYSSQPTLKPGANPAVSWSINVPMAVTYTYGAGRVVYFNDLWVWYGGHWTGDTPYGMALMQNTLRYIHEDEGFFDCNHNGVLDLCDLRDGTSLDTNDNGIPDECDACGVCSDGVFCNGVEFCDVTGTCQPGTQPCSAPQFCNEEENECRTCEVDVDCDDALFCNGVESCVGELCYPGTDPCPGQYCSESDERCLDCLTDAHCDDGDPCNGIEWCDVDGNCEPGAIIDCNGNDAEDFCDLAGGTSEDCNGNDVPDECDAAGATSEDCNTNDVPDECEPDEDCNTNGVQDICDIAGETSEDCNVNDVPDECEPDEDCNTNGVQDICDIAAGTSFDCNGNLVPDECDLAEGTSHDHNGTGVPDECDIVAPWPEDSLGIACTDDEECDDAATCVNGVCYAPKHRYISIRSNPEQVANSARRVRLDTGEALGWIGAPYESLGLTLAEVVPFPAEPVYLEQWPDVVHVTGCEIATGQTYMVQAVQMGLDVGDERMYSEALVLHTPSAWGDTVSTCAGNECKPPDGIVGLADILAAIGYFQGETGIAPLTWLDIAPSLGSGIPDQVVGLADISGFVSGFQGSPYPGLGPLNCP